MEQIHANLLGNWVNLQDDPDCVMGHNKVSPYIWYEESALMQEWDSPKRVEGISVSFYDFPHIWLNYKGVDYRIHPSHIQVVVN